MNKFNLLPFNSTKLWEEAISIYYYLEFFRKDRGIADFDLNTYGSLEVWDDQVEEYNLWLSEISAYEDRYILFTEDKFQILEEFKTNYNITFKPKVILWRKRYKNEYFKKQLQEAFEFENYIAKKIKDEYEIDIEPYLTPDGQYELGENALGIEIKNDKLIKKFGNIYIEVAEKSDKSLPNYTKSGILKKDNSIYFLFGDYEDFYIFFKKTLLEIYREELKLFKNNKVSNRGIKFKKIDTSQGFVYPIKNAIVVTITFEQMMEEILANKK